MKPENTDTFLSVIEANKGIIYKVANAWCQDADDKKDLVQEIILQIWRSFDKYNKQYQYSTWIYRIALNVSISFFRKENNRKTVRTADAGMVVDFSDTAYDTETEHKLNLLQQFIAQLKEIDKALMLLYLEEKSHKEMAEITGLSETNVATRISRIKTILKQKFSTIEN
ncbi:MAG: sigM 2 [Bacteroidetes bacterium]|jgi:RNA polymerase sigma-70 factor (ECF subfamily)|nr:sigM 2 [Bacteroidota bacterium]